MFLLGQKSIFHCYCLQNVKDGSQIQVYNINYEIANHFGQFISVKGKKTLRKSQAQFREKLRKVRLRQNYGFLIKKTCNGSFLPMGRLLGKDACCYTFLLPRRNHFVRVAIC